MCVCVCVLKVKLVTVAVGNPKAPFSFATIPRCKGATLFLHFTLDLYLIMLSVKQGAIMDRSIGMSR